MIADAMLECDFRPSELTVCSHFEEHRFWRVQHDVSFDLYRLGCKNRASYVNSDPKIGG
jgi:hypothetical protein